MDLITPMMTHIAAWRMYKKIDTPEDINSMATFLVKYAHNLERFEWYTYTQHTHIPGH